MKYKTITSNSSRDSDRKLNEFGRTHNVSGVSTNIVPNGDGLKYISTVTYEQKGKELLLEG